MVPDASLKTNESFAADGVTLTPLNVLNVNGDADGWNAYWTVCGDSDTNKTNNGYFALNRQVTWETTDIATAQVSLASNAEYSGLQSIPQATVVLDGITLAQGIDFRVVPQPTSETDCIEVTDEGEAPYRAKIVGLGSYSGEASALLEYGMSQGDLANSSVLIGQKHFNWEGQVPDDVKVVSPAGTEIGRAHV